MADGVERVVSPCGQRAVLVDHHTGEVWLARRLPKPEADDALAMLPRWRALSNRPVHRGSLQVIPGQAS